MSRQPTYVAFTCDTEGMYPRVFPHTKTSCWDIGVEGETPSGPVGTPLLCDMLERAGGRGTFFMDINAVDYVGEGPVKRTCDQLLQRGHDVQLHFHSHYEFTELPNRNELMYSVMPQAVQHFREAILLSADRFEKICGYRSTVYRAGGYRLLPAMLPALKEAGIRAEATIWPDPRRRADVSDDLRWRNAPSWHDDLLVLPVTHYVEMHQDRPPLIRQFNFSARRRHVYEALLDIAGSADLGLVSLMAHSSTFMAYGYENTYKQIANRLLEVHSDAVGNGLKGCYADWFTSDEKPKMMLRSPDTSRIQEYENFFESIAERPDLRLITLRDYTDKVLEGSINVPERRCPLFPLPRYDLKTKQASLDFVRRYNTKLVVDTDKQYRAMDDKAVHTKPPEEIIAAAKQKGIL